MTIDLRGMKVSLQAHASARGLPISVFVRDALAQLIETGERTNVAPDSCAARTRRVRVSLRLREDEARDLRQRARAAGRPLGAYVIELSRTGLRPISAEERNHAVAALTRSNAELASLRRDIAHLTALLRQGAVRAAQEYRRTLETLDADVRAHLTVVSRVLANPTQRHDRQEVPHG